MSSIVTHCVASVSHSSVPYANITSHTLAQLAALTPASIMRLTQPCGSLIGLGLLVHEKAEVQLIATNPKDEAQCLRSPEEYWTGRFEAAARLRNVIGLPSSATTSYRLLHGFADSVPGIFVDVHGAHAVCRIRSAAAKLHLFPHLQKYLAEVKRLDANLEGQVTFQELGLELSMAPNMLPPIPLRPLRAAWAETCKSLHTSSRHCIVMSRCSLIASLSESAGWNTCQVSSSGSSGAGSDTRAAFVDDVPLRSQKMGYFELTASSSPSLIQFISRLAAGSVLFVDTYTVGDGPERLARQIAAAHRTCRLIRQVEAGGDCPTLLEQLQLRPPRSVGFVFHVS